MNKGVRSGIAHDSLLFQGADWDFGTIQRIP